MKPSKATFWLSQRKFQATVFLALLGLIPRLSEAAAGPVAFPGSEPHVYRNISPVPLWLYVFKPEHWRHDDRRTAFIWFFGGGWRTGDAHDAVPWAKWAADLGMVGVAPDYRVSSRFDSTPADATADGRAIKRWVEDHASDLGVDPRHIVVGGFSAGGHLALWTAISHSPPGSTDGEAPRIKPAALILLSPASDTSNYADLSDYYKMSLSPIHQLDSKMPAVLLFHGTADQSVPYGDSVALCERLVASGSFCKLVTIRDGTHMFYRDKPAYLPTTRAIAAEFLRSQGLIHK
jgi:acetyl esterase/lipase